MDWTVGVITNNFKTIGGFGKITHKAYHWTETITADKYVKELLTTPNLDHLDAGLRNKVYSKIHAVIDNYGGCIEVPHALALFHARVKR